MTAPTAPSAALTPFEMGQQDAQEAIARGVVPSREALDKVAAIIAASQEKPAAGQADGAAA